MNVNPFSYLIEKLKGKVDKSGDTMTGELKVDTGTSTDSIVSIGGSQNYGALRLKAGTTGKQGTIITASLTANRNYILPNNGGTLALTSDITPSSWDIYTVGTRDLYVRKIGGMVEMYFWTDETLPATTTICTLADKYKPSLPTYPNLFVVHDYLANDDLEIHKDGKIKTVSSPKSGWKVFHATWGV